MQPTISQGEARYGSLSSTSNENPFHAASRSKAAKKAPSDDWDADGWGNDGWADSKDDWNAKDGDWGFDDSWGDGSSKKNRSSVTRNNGDW